MADCSQIPACSACAVWVIQSQTAENWGKVVFKVILSLVFNCMCRCGEGWVCFSLLPWLRFLWSAFKRSATKAGVCPPHGFCLLSVLGCEQEFAYTQARRKGLAAFEELKHCLDVENQCCRVRGVGRINATKVFFSFNADFNSVNAASVFYELMLRLGFSEFYAQGGDYGWLICTNLAQIAPRWVPPWCSCFTLWIVISCALRSSCPSPHHVGSLFGAQC